MQIPSLPPFFVIMLWRLTYAKAKRKSVDRWKEKTLSIIMKFSTGYRSSAVFNGPWHTNKKKWNDGNLSPEEALYVWESIGRDPYDSCTDKAKFLELLERKDVMNLTISMWKQEKDPILYLVLRKELYDEFPHEWLKQIGITFGV